MKQNLPNRILMLVVAFLTISFNLLGAEQTATFTMKNTGQSSPVTVNGVTFTWTSSNIVVGTNNSSGFKANSNMTITIPAGKKLTAIEKGNGNTWGGAAQIVVYAGTNSSGTTIATITKDSHTYSIANNNTGTTYYFANTTSANAWINSLTIKYDDNTSGDPTDGITFSFVTHPSNWPISKEKAAEGTYNYTINTTTYAFTHTKVGDGIYLAGTSGSSGYLLMVAGNKLGLPAIEGYKLTKVVGTLNGQGTPSTASQVSITDGTNLVEGGTSQTWSTKGESYTYNLTGTSANTVYYMEVANKNCQMINLSLTYEDDDTPATYTASVVSPAPSNGSILLSKTNGSFAAGPLSDLTASTTYYFQVTPNTGYHIQDGSVKVNNSTDGVTKVSGDATGAVYSYTTGSANMTISAAFDINTYIVTAVSNDENMGTVRVDGTTITASPKQGYRVVADAGGYTVTAGTATVSHTGNSQTLTVTPSSDCMVRINFEAIPMTTINWVVGGQAYSVGTPTASIATGSQYSALTLPTAPADNTIGDCADHFMGWSTSNLGTTLGQSAPAVLFKSVAGNETEITGSEVTFYAVFATGGGDVALNGAFADRTVGNGGVIDLSGFSKTIDGVTYSFAKNAAGTEPRQTTAGRGLPECVRLFAKNSMTISVTSGNITQIVLTQYDGTNALTANVGTYDADTKTWTGSASSVTFTVGGESGHNKYTNISVTTSNGVVASDYVTECVPANKTVYLNTGGRALWNKDDQGQPKFAIYYMGGSANATWSDFMTETCTAGIYEGIVPGDATQIIFVRLKNTCVTPGSWDDKWNQSPDLDVPDNSNDQYTIGAWDNSTNSWGVYAPAMKSITFDDKGADNGAAMATINDVACGSDQKLPAMTRTKVGHDFAGWATTDGGEVVYADGATIENVRADISLFAKWNVKSYTLTWNFDGGSTSATEGSEYTAGGSVAFGADITYPADNTMSKEGYHFTGWSSTPATMPDGNLTLTAQWEVNSYDVKWYVNGVEYVNGGSTSVNHGAAMSTLTLPTAPADNALSCKDKFMGWSETDLGRAEGQGAPGDLFTSLTSNATTITGEKNFYAVFADAEAGGGPASLTKLGSGATFAEGDEIVVVAKSGDNYYGMYQETVSTSYVNYFVLDHEPTISDIDDAKKHWTLTASENNTWILGDATNGYLQNATNNLYANTEQSTPVTIAWNSTKSKFTIKNESRWIGCRADLTGDNQYKWRGAGDQPNPTTNSVCYLDIYKYSDGGGTTYSNYVTTCSTDPTIMVDPTSITGLGYVENYGGTNNTAKTFTVGGRNLTENITVTAGDNYEISLDGSSYAAAQTTTKNVNTTVYVRLKADKAQGDYSADAAANKITCSSAGADAQTISLSGSVVAKELQSIAINAGSTHKTSYTLGETFDPSGLQIDATYNSGVEVITYDGSNMAFSKEGAITASDATVQVTFDGKNVDINLTLNCSVEWLVKGVAYTKGGAVSSIALNGTVNAPTVDPTSAECDGSKVFMGWIAADEDYESETTAPTGMFTKTSGTISQNTTFRAVFATSKGYGNTFTKFTGTPLESGQYLFVEENNGSYARMGRVLQAKSGTPTTYYLTGIVTTVTDDKIDLSDNEERDMTVYVVTKNGDNYTIANLYNQQQGENAYLNIDGSTLLYGATGTNYTVEYGTKGWQFTSTASGSSTMLSAYYTSGSYRFNAYNSFSNTLHLFKRDGGYADYTTACIETFAINYECDGATSGCPDNAEHQTVLPNPLATPTKTGFSFDNWYTNPEKTTPADAGAALTDDATLYAKWTPNNPGTVTITSLNDQYHFWVGDQMQFTATAQNEIAADATYQWYLNGTAEGNKILGATGATLTIDACEVVDAGKYYCTIDNHGQASTSAFFGATILQLYQKDNAGNDQYNAPLNKEDGTWATIDLNLTGNTTYRFNITDGCNNWYGNDGTMNKDNCTGWPFNSSNDCHITTTKTGTYTVRVNYTNLAQPAVTVVYPSNNQAAGINIYFDNTSRNWTTDKIYYRIGKTTNNAKQQMAIVPGTRNLYKVTTDGYLGFDAWHIANNGCWSDGHSIYKTKTGDGWAANEAMAFVGDEVTADATYQLTESHELGGDDQNNNCQFYGYTRTDGMLTHNARIETPSHGTLNVTYTNVDGVAGQTLTTDDAALAHTCILNISATPATGYENSLVTRNGVAYGLATYDLVENSVFAVTFSAKTSAITFNANGGKIDGEDTKVMDYTYDGEELVLPTPTRTGFAFVGWYTATTDGALIDNVGGSNKPATATEYFAIWRELAVISFEVSSGVAAVANIYEGETFPSAANITDCGDAGYDYTFVGWVTEAIAEETATAPGTIYEAGATCELGTTQTLKALYSKNGYRYVKMDHSNISNIVSEKYVVVGNLSSTNYAICSTTSTDANPSHKVVTLANAGDSITGVTDDIIWNVTKNLDGTIIMSNAEGKYLRDNSGNTNVRVLSSSCNWTLSRSTSPYGFYLKNERYMAIYRNNGTNDCRAYTGTSNSNATSKFYFYKRTAVPGKYITTINCAKRQPVSLALTGEYPTVFDVNDAFSHEGMTVTATYDNGDEENVTASATFVDNTTGETVDMTTAGSKTIKVSYTENGGTATTTYTITIQQTYTVTYAANGATSGTVPVNSNKYHTGDKVTVEGNTGNLDKTGNTFGGWSYGGNTYQADEQVTVGTENVTLTAVWNARTAATLTLSVKGVETPLAGTHYVDDVIALPTTVSTSVVGYTFVGWSCVTIPTPATKPAENYFAKGADYTLAAEAQTLYAVYARGTGAMTKYSAELITEAEDIVDGGKYIIEQAGRVALPTVSSGEMATTNIFAATSLTGNEDYVWTFTTNNTGFNLKKGSSYLRESNGSLSLTGTEYMWNVTYDETNSRWKIADNDRYLGYKTGETVYKAYSTSTSYNSTTYPHEIQLYRLLGNYTTDPFAGYKVYVETDGATWNTTGTHSYQDMSDETRTYTNVDEIITTGEPTTVGLWYEFNLEAGRSWPTKSEFTVQMGGADVDWDYEFGSHGEAYLYLMAAWTGDVYIHLEACDGTLAAPEVEATYTSNVENSSITLTWPAVAEATYEATLNTSPSKTVVDPAKDGDNYTATFNGLQDGETYNWQVVVSKDGCMNMANGSVTIAETRWTVTYHDAEGDDQTEEVTHGGNPTMTGIAARACSDANRVFVGWVADEALALTQTAPETVDPTTITITAAKDFYAVYASRNGGKTGLEVVLATEDFRNMPDDWSFSANAARNATDPFTAQLNYLAHNTTTVSYVKSNDKFADMSKIMLDAYISGGCTAHKFAVQYSTDGENWNTIGENRKLFGNAVWYRDQTFMMPSVQDAYVRIVTVPSDLASVCSLYVDNIKVYTKPRKFYNTDYATSCDMAARTTLTYDAQGGNAQTAVTEAGWVTLPTGAECERGCYTLTGWLCSGDDKTYEPGAKYLFNHDVTMTAQWEVDTEASVTVTYHTGLEGAETVTVENVHCGDILTESQIPTPDACGHNVFAGWAIGAFDNAASKDGIAQYAVGTDVVMGNMELHAIWKQGTSEFTKYFETDVVAGTYILVDPSTSKALSATLVPTPVTIDGTTITTDEHFIQWTVAKVGEQFSILGMDGYLTITADKTQALGISNSAVETWNMKESSTNGVYNIGITFDASDRRVCYNSTKDKWLSYKNRTSGNLYKLSGDGPATFTMDGVCPHIYHATGVSEMTSGTGVSVMAKENGLIIVENTSVVPVAQKVSGDDVFVVTVNPTSTGTNGDGSLNYEYSVKFTPTAGNQTYTATYKFIGTDETEDEKHIASEAITFTGYSLPDQFAIVAVKNGQYFAMPGDVPNAEASANAIPVTVVGGEITDLDMAHAYSVYTGSRTTEDRTTVRMKSTTGALWASNSSTNIYNFAGDLTANTAAATTNTQWTLERAYDDGDNFLGYHLISDADSEKGLFYYSGHWGYYSNSRYGGEYAGEIFFLPIAAQFGDIMDIVEWNGSSIVLNMNGYGATNGKWGVKNASDEMLLAGDRAADRTLEVSTAALVADQYLNIKVYGNANNAPAEPVVESNRNYKIPHIMTGAQNITSAASFSATSILYVKSGTTTVNVNLTVSKVVVCPGAELVVASGKTLTTNDLVLRGKVWTYEQPKLTNNGTINATNTYYTRIVADKKEYYPFGLPKSSRVATVRLSNGQEVTYGETSNWNLRYYDGAARAERGNNAVSDWKNLTSGTIAAKTYYIMGSGSAYYREYYFPIDLNESVGNTVAIAANQGASAANNGWNGFASPYTDVYTNAPTGDPSEFVKVTEKVENNTQWWQHVPSQLYPFFPYFYQTEAAGTLTFGSGLTFAASASVAARAQVNEPQVTTQWVQVLLSNGAGESDEANLYVHPTKFTIGYDKQDLMKMKGEGGRPQVWTRMACGDLSFNALPDSVAEGRIPVGLTTGGASNMVFSIGREDYLDRVEAVNLIDDVLGITTNLMENDYEWSPVDGVDNRFYLSVEIRKTPAVTTDISDGGGDGCGRDIRKVIYNDKLYIIVDGKVFDATGKTVK